jgi:hypothetical protein
MPGRKFVLRRERPVIPSAASVRVRDTIATARAVHAIVNAAEEAGAVSAAAKILRYR